MELALIADIDVASEHAKFGELFVVRGLCCDAPGLSRLAQLVGRETAAELLFTGDVIDANQAKNLGLVGRVVPGILEAAIKAYRLCGAKTRSGKPFEKFPSRSNTGLLAPRYELYIYP